MGQFHLRLGMGGAGSLGKDVEDEVGPVEHLGLGQGLAEVAELGRAQLVVEDEQVDVILLDVRRNLLELAFSNEGAHIGTVQGLRERPDGLCVRRPGEEFEFIEVFGQKFTGLIAGGEAYEDGAFGIPILAGEGFLQHLVAEAFYIA